MSLQNKKLLLVEDSPTDAILLERFLVKNDCACQVKHVSTLATACDALASERYDAVVLDLNLPDSASLPTLHAVRSRSEDIPIVVLSGEHDVSLVQQAASLGVAAFLNKNSDSLMHIATVIRKTLLTDFP